MKMGLLGVLGVVFVVLKLCKVIAWSWWLVLLPFYLWVPFVVVMALIACSASIGLEVIKRIEKKKK